MPRDLCPPDLTTSPARAQLCDGAATPQAVLAALLGPERPLGRLALVSSFGAESAVLLHMVAAIDPATPVLVLDTGMLFAESIDYRDQLIARLGLTNVQVLRPDPDAVVLQDQDGRRHRSDPDGCCHLRKVVPLERALRGFDGWITGRKRFQAASRSALPLVEADGPDRIKVNPLAAWGPQELAAYARAHDLPAHSLVARGYLSIGCAPCTTPVAAGEDPRAGRWRGQAKVECGIHIVDGRILRSTAAA